MPEQRVRVSQLFAEALNCKEADRPEFLHRACAGDESLRLEVASLLAHASTELPILDTPLEVWAADALHFTATSFVGRSLGSYQILSGLGAGGMGEVYRAHDHALGRDVAIKILPANLASHAERQARFKREARLLAALNHPNIGAIYGLEEFDRVFALVLELVEGETLADRIARGPMPIDDVLRTGKQIADALESAHEHGIIHRDLKPANVKLRPDGTVKVLDFGLAKAFEPGAPDAVSATVSAALSLQSSGAGVILGTAPYVAPEHARGHAVDTRADIWALGVVLFEMLTARHPFDGDDVAAMLAAVMTKEPDWSLLPARLPQDFRRLLHRCLEKDPKRRLQAIGDARLEIEDLLDSKPDDPVTVPAAVPPRAIAAATAVFVTGIVLAALFTWVLARPGPTAPPQSVRFAIVPTAAQSLVRYGSLSMALSPDGKAVVYVGGTLSERRLLVRSIDHLDPLPAGDATDASSPFFSPDGRWIGFFTGALGGELRKVSTTGGPSVPLARTRGLSGGAAWGPDDSIVFGTYPRVPGIGLLRIAASGGQPTVLTRPDGEENHLFPSMLPDGRAVLFTITSGDSFANTQVAVLDLTTGQRKTLIRDGSQAEYVDASTGSPAGGFLLYAAAGVVRAVRFDPVKLEVLSDPVVVVDSVSEFSVSRQGTLAYVPGVATGTRTLVWVDRQGRDTPIVLPPRAYIMSRLSPQGDRIAVTINDAGMHIWIADFARSTLRRLTDTPSWDGYPVWMPDGRRIVFGSERAERGTGNLFWQVVDNPATVERLTTSPNRQGPSSISPDGTRLVFNENMPITGWDQRVLRLPSADGPVATEPLLQTAATELFGEVSPDGRWLAYQSDESGRSEIWVRPFPNVGGGHWQVSTGGGITPVWARDQKELFYLAPGPTLMSVPIQTTPAFSVGQPVKLFSGPYSLNPTLRTYDVSPDGRRFLMIKHEGDSTAPPTIVVVLNFLQELAPRLTRSR